MAAVLEAMRLQQDVGDRFSAEALDATIVHHAIDRLAIALTPIVEEQLERLRPSVEVQPIAPPPKSPATESRSGFREFFGYAAAAAAALLAFGLIRVATERAHPSRETAGPSLAAPPPITVTEPPAAAVPVSTTTIDTGALTSLPSGYTIDQQPKPHEPPTVIVFQNDRAPPVKKRSACQYEAVMTDAEIAACR